MLNIAVILSGCGVYDGSEIHEATLTLLSIEKLGHQTQCFAPSMPQIKTINHLNQTASTDTRNTLQESARIARGNIQPLDQAQNHSIDAVIFPGGFGAATQLCDFANKGAKASLHPEVKTLASNMLAQKKPMGFLCIAAVMVPLIYPPQARCTIGNDPETAQTIETMGAKHINCHQADEVVIDQQHQICSSPAYMLAKNLLTLEKSIHNCLSSLIHMTLQKSTT
jgi:enhancing lycopene biosynthesis protein 2